MRSDPTDADTLRAQMAASTDPARLEREAMRAQLVVMPEAPDDATLDAIGHKLYPYARGLGEFERKMARQIYTHVREALSEPRVVKVTGVIERKNYGWVLTTMECDPKPAPPVGTIIKLAGEYEVQP